MFWNIYVVILIDLMLRGVKVTSFVNQAAYCWHHHCPAGLSHVAQTGKERISEVDSFRVVTLKTEVQKWLWQPDVSCCNLSPIYLKRIWELDFIYKVFQGEMSIFFEVIVSVILSKKCICACVLFRTVSEMELFHCTRFWIWRQIVYVTPAVRRHCMKHVTRREASVGCFNWVHDANCSIS